jgi:hypothetical protein
MNSKISMKEYLRRDESTALFLSIIKGPLFSIVQARRRKQDKAQLDEHTFSRVHTSSLGSLNNYGIN